MIFITRISTDYNIKVVSAIYNYAEITIRRAELFEVDTVKKIIEEAYEPVKKQLSGLPEALRESIDKIARHIQMGDQYVAIVGEEIVGTMRVRLRGQIGVVSRVAVLKKFRGRRIGSALLEYAENMMSYNNAKCIEVEVYGIKEQQIDFYRNIGYEEVDRIERYGEEVVVMQKAIKDDELEEEEIL